MKNALILTAMFMAIAWLILLLDWLGQRSERRSSKRHDAWFCYRVSPYAYLQVGYRHDPP